jgi:hypothetical protein
VVVLVEGSVVVVILAVVAPVVAGNGTDSASIESTQKTYG